VELQSKPAKSLRRASRLVSREPEERATSPV